MDKRLSDSLLGTLKQACILCGALAGGCLVGVIIGSILGVLYVFFGAAIFWVLVGISILFIFVLAWNLHHSKE